MRPKGNAGFIPIGTPKRVASPLTRMIALCQKEYPGKDIYEDRQLEITSFLPISVEGQIAAMDKVLA